MLNDQLARISIQEASKLLATVVGQCYWVVLG